VAGEKEGGLGLRGGRGRRGAGYIRWSWARWAGSPRLLRREPNKWLSAKIFSKIFLN
jgi:hypothetical protein